MRADNAQLRADAARASKPQQQQPEAVPGAPTAQAPEDEVSRLRTLLVASEAALGDIAAETVCFRGKLDDAVRRRNEAKPLGVQAATAQRKLAGKQMALDKAVEGLGAAEEAARRAQQAILDARSARDASTTEVAEAAFHAYNMRHGWHMCIQVTCVFTACDTVAIHS